MMAICEKCIKQSVCKLCDGSEIMGCIEFVGKGSNVLTTDRDEVKLLVETPKSLYEAAFEGRYTRYDSLNCIKAIRDGQILPDDCEILTKEAYADLCLRASKGNCSEISTGSTVKIDVPDNNVGNIDCISRADARSLVVKIGRKDILGMSGKTFQDLYKGINELPSVTPQSCNDAVSRKDVHDMLENLPITVEDKWFNWLQKACMRLADLPSVTPQEPFINKPCVSEKVCEHDKNAVLDKVRAEIEETYINLTYEENHKVGGSWGLRKAMEIIDKYKAEIEPQERSDKE